MGSRRTFVGIEISEESRGVCMRHIEELRHLFPDARVGWELPEKLHITLKFLGETSEQQMGPLANGMAAIASRYHPFQLRLSSSGVFPSASRPRILWIGVEGDGGLEALQRDIERLGRDIGFEVDDRKFHPHITIGRVRDPRSTRELTNAHVSSEIQPAEFDVGEIVLFESKLLADGSVYSEMVRHKLGGSYTSRSDDRL